MRYADMRPGKGFLKNYNHWLNDHLYDYWQSYEPGNPLEKVNVDQLENFSQTVTFNGRRTRIYRKPRVEKERRVRVRSSFDGLLFFKTIFEKGTISSWLMYLTAKDVFALIETSKDMRQLLDCKEVWRSLINRDFDHPSNRVLEEQQISLKHFYQYKQITSRIGIVYNTGSFLERSLAYEAKLARTIVDFTAVTNAQIKSLLSCEGVENGMTNDLKLSWDKQKNKIVLWFSGYSVKKSTTSVYTSNTPIAHAIQTYKFPKTYPIRNTWFYKDKFLVIEVDSLDVLEYKESNQTVRKKKFYLYNLNTEIEYGVTGQGKILPMTFSFCEKSGIHPEEIVNLSFRDSNEQDITIWIDQNEEEKEELKIQSKVLQNDKIIFFSKERKISTLIILNLNDGKTLFQTVLSLKAPIMDIFESKLTTYANDNFLYLVDESSNLYKISYAVNTLLELVHINPEKGQIEEKRKPAIQLPPTFERFPDSTRRYHQGIYWNNYVGKEQQEIEYIMFLKNRSYFEVIEIESFDVRKFALPDKVAYGYISDWYVLEDKLFVLTNEEMTIWKFAFPNFKIEQVGDSLGTQWRNHMYYKQWIQADTCFTVLVSSHGESFYELDKMEILINPTQGILGGVSDKLTQGFRTDVHDILLRPSNIEYPFKLIPQNVQIKYQNGKLLITVSNYSFFCDLNTTIGYAGGLALNYVQNRWVPTQTIDIRKVIKPNYNSNTKVNKEVLNKSRNFIDYKPIPINKNKRKEKINWFHCPKKDNILSKGYREENLLTRRKGYKYVKNRRGEERSRKYLNLPNQSNDDNSEVEEDFSIDI